MQNIFVSIIIPIYKVEPYIVRCIESLLHQTYRNLEVILIDDCSPDRSMELAKDCITQSPLSKDLSFVYLCHDHNRGLSAARNTGIEVATGNYVWFVDSDDMITENAAELIISLFNANDCDIIGFDLIRTFESSNKEIVFPIIINNHHREKYGLILRNNEIRNIIERAPVQRFVFKHDFLQSHKLLFYEGIIHEDVEFMGRAFFFANSILLCNTPIYKYLLRDSGSIMTNLDNSIHSLECCNIIIESLSQFKAKNAKSFYDIFYLNDYIFRHLLVMLGYKSDVIENEVSAFIRKHTRLYRRIAFQGFIANLFFLDFRRCFRAFRVMISPSLWHWYSTH
jgi:glycosyltransferase involved in cell wall biosynthesis